MQITKMKCPACGADITADREGMTKCPYCGSTFYVEADKPPVTMNTTINNFNGPSGQPDKTTEQTGNQGIGLLFVFVIVFLALALTFGFSRQSDDTEADSTVSSAETSRAATAGTIEAPVTELTLDISKDGVESLSMLPSNTSLKSLEINNADTVTDWSVLSKLPGLESLTIRKAKELNDVSFLSGMPKLRKLSLSDTAVSDLSILNGNLSVTALYLENNLIADYSFLPTMTSLQSLHIRGYSGKLPDLSGLKLLKEKDIQ